LLISNYNSLTFKFETQTNKTKTIMKKSITLVALAFGVTSAFAQDLTSKKGEPFLPEAGDYAVSVDATPFLNYVGNFFGKTGPNNAPTWNFLNGNNTITGKYFKDATTAYRVGVRLGFGSTTDKRNVAALPTSTVIAYPTADAVVENKHHQGKTNVGISVGIEKRKGKTRLQGFYGADAGIYFGSTTDKYTYGNALAGNSGTPVNVTAADDFGTGNTTASIVSTGQVGSARITKMKSGATVSFGVRAFVGAEYFIIPKLSIGGEFGWGLGLSMTGKSTTTYESVGFANGAANTSVGTTEVKGGKSSAFGLDTDNKNGVFGPSASLRMAFHF
jgi:hypothetical protein